MTVRRLSREEHAQTDFLASSWMLLAPCILPLSARTAGISWGLAVAGFLVGSHTRYPFPLRGCPVISWRAHRHIENASFPAFVLVAYRSGAWRRPLDAAYLLVLFGAYLYTHAVTNWSDGWEATDSAASHPGAARKLSLSRRP